MENENTIEENASDELVELKNRYAYLAADFDNYRKRMRRETSDIASRTTGRLVLDLLPVLDDLERCINANGFDKTDGRTVSETSMIVNLTYENLLKILSSWGCSRIECGPGDRFDVNRHEAISTRKPYEGEDLTEDDICEIYQAGYELDGRLIRPVKVVTVRNG